MSLFDLLVPARKGSLTMAVTVALLIGLILQMEQLIAAPHVPLPDVTADEVHLVSPDPKR